MTPAHALLLLDARSLPDSTRHPRERHAETCTLTLTVRYTSTTSELSPVHLRPAAGPQPRHVGRCKEVLALHGRKVRRLSLAQRQLRPEDAVGRKNSSGERTGSAPPPPSSHRGHAPLERVDPAQYVQAVEFVVVVAQQLLDVTRAWC